MNVVIDTNVLVSGWLNARLAPGMIVQLLIEGTIQLCYDARILSEYQEVMARPHFGFPPEAVSLFLDHLVAQGRLTSARPLSKRLHDPDDEPFVEVALAAGLPAYLVTGNLKHFPATHCEGVRILSPTEFIDMLRKTPNLYSL